MKTILALIDFSDVTPRVLDQAYTLARAFGSQIYLIHVVPPDPVVVDFAPVPVFSDDFNLRQQQLMALRDILIARGVPVTAEQYSGPVLDTMITHIKPIDPDLIIMGSHGHGALYDLVVGSVTKGIIKHAEWPVMVVPCAPTMQSQRQKPAVTENTKKEWTTELVGALGGSLLPP